MIGGDRVIDGTRHGAQGGLVEDVVHPSDGLLAVFQVADVAFNEAEVGPLLCCDGVLNFVQVVLVTGGKVVQADNGLVEAQQGFQQVGADEAGHAGDQPGFGIGR